MKTVRERLIAASANGRDIWTAGGANEAQIQALERALQLKLPPSYREFLSSTGAELRRSRSRRNHRRESSRPLGWIGVWGDHALSDGLRFASLASGHSAG